jgi:hypothetical protein
MAPCSVIGGYKHLRGISYSYPEGGGKFSSEMLTNIILHGVISQKTVMDVLTSVRTPNPRLIYVLQYCTSLPRGVRVSQLFCSRTTSQSTRDCTVLSIPITSLFCLKSRDGKCYCHTSLYGHSYGDEVRAVSKSLWLMNLVI